MNNTIDCIFDINNQYTVLIKRKNDPFKGYWALPGGRIQDGESLEDAVVREVKEETGLEIKIKSRELPTPVKVLDNKTYLEQVRTYMGADPRGGAATVYAVQVKTDPKELSKILKNGDDAEDVRVCRLDMLPPLAFDHEKALEDYFCRLKKYKNPIPTTDTIIEYDKGIVLITRKNPPFGIAIPGGFAECGLSFEENAVKEAKEETGLNVELKKLLNVYSEPTRDPRGHMISATYIGKGWGELKAGDDAKTAKVYSIPEVKELIQENKLVFDHAKILERYLRFKEYER